MLIAQAILYGLLAIAGAIYLFLQLFAAAFVENALRCEGRGMQDPPPADSPAQEPTLLSWLLPERVQAWLRHFHQHLAITLIVSALAGAFSIANIADVRPVDLTDARGRSPPASLFCAALRCCCLNARSASAPFAAGPISSSTWGSPA